MAEQEVIYPDALMLNTINAKTSQLVGRKIMDVEKELVLSTLNWCEGDRLYAANVLGISIKALTSKLDAYT
jgi:DNA-binding NtrC family response regulator